MAGRTVPALRIPGIHIFEEQVAAQAVCSACPQILLHCIPYGTRWKDSGTSIPFSRCPSAEEAAAVHNRCDRTWHSASPKGGSGLFRILPRSMSAVANAASHVGARSQPESRWRSSLHSVKLYPCAVFGCVSTGRTPEGDASSSGGISTGSALLVTRTNLPWYSAQFSRIIFARRLSVASK